MALVGKLLIMFFQNGYIRAFEKDLSKADALVYLDIWQELVEKSGFSCFQPFLTTLNQWRNEIGNYFIDRESSGFVEGLNNKIKVFKRRC